VNNILEPTTKNEIIEALPAHGRTLTQVRFSPLREVLNEAQRSGCNPFAERGTKSA